MEKCKKVKIWRNTFKIEKYHLENLKEFQIWTLDNINKALEQLQQPIPWLRRNEMKTGNTMTEPTLSILYKQRSDLATGLGALGVAVLLVSVA